MRRTFFTLIVLLLLSRSVLAQTITDAFNRADSSTTMGNTDTGQTWTVLADTDTGCTPVWGISSNKAYDATPCASVGQDHAWVESNISDATIAVTVSSIDAGSDVGLVFRLVDRFNYLLASFDNRVPEVSIYKNVADSFTLLNNATYTVANGDVISVVLSGSSIIVKANGVTKVSTTDSTFQTATKHGLRQYGPTTIGRFDDFSITPPTSTNKTLMLLGVGPR